MKKMLLTIVLMIASLIASIPAAEAAGVDKIVGSSATWTCSAPTTLSDGSPVPTGTTWLYTVYVTQAVPNKGTAVGSSSQCNITASTKGMALGQWHSYVTASGTTPATATSPAITRPESGVSNDAPFTLSSDPTIPSSPPTNATVK